MKKKMLALILASAMVTGLLAGCGSEEAADTASNDTATETTAEETAADSTTEDAPAEETASSGEKTVVTIFNIHGNPTRDALVKEIVESQLGDHIEVEFISPPGDQAINKRTTMLQSQEDIDIIEGMELYYIENGWLECLDDYVENWDGWDTMLPNIKEYEYKKGDGHVYGIPYARYERCLFYRKDWLEEAGLEVPGTWQELYDAAVALTDPSQNRYGYAMRGANNISWVEMTLNSALGSEYLTPYIGSITKELKSIWEYPEAIESAEYWRDLYKYASNPDSISWAYAETVEAFYSGTAGFLIQDPEVIATCEEYMEEGTWGTAPLPVDEESGESWYGGGSGEVWCMTSWCDNKDAAWEVMAVLNSQEGNMTFSKANGSLPCQSSEGDPFFDEGYYSAYTTMASDQVKYRTQTDMSGIFATNEEMEVMNSFTAAEGDVIFQELIMEAVSPEVFCEKLAMQDAWAADSEWLPEKLAE